MLSASVSQQLSPCRLIPDQTRVFAMRAAIVFAFIALVAPIYGQSDESLQLKNHDKRGILGLGGHGHGLLGSSLSISHGIALPAIAHTPIIAAPVIHAPVLELGHSIGLGHGLSLGHGLHGW